jgi:peptidoglycan/LPS O-acetylase OafA/YrhL
VPTRPSATATATATIELDLEHDLGLDADPTPQGPRPAVRIPYAPGLDGLRGLAVLAVLVFHAAPATWLPGGFLGVSLFFTLSGYLITSLVLTEVRRDRAVDLASFWARRMRRLVPALVLTTVGVLLLAELVDLGTPIRSDQVGGLTYTANWVQIWQGQGYADLFLAPSPLDHLWSLAIEEQFYLVLPLVALGLTTLGPWMVRTRLAVIAGLTIVVGSVATIITTDPTIGYYSTLDRSPEIAIGVLLACVARASTAPARRPLAIAGFVALALAAWACATVQVADELVTSGGLLLFALLSATMVLAASRPGTFSAVLSIGPLRRLGLISYGLYLYHWPVVVLVDERRTGLDPVELFATRMVISLALALLSYVLVEQPIRHARPQVPSGRVVVAGLLSLAACLVLVLIVLPPDRDPTPASEPAPAVVELAEARQPDPEPDPIGAGGSAEAPALPDQVASTAAAPPVVTVLGDSVPAWLIRDGASILDPDDLGLLDATLAACDGADGTPEARSSTGALVPVPDGCTGWKQQYPPYFEQGTTDIAVLMLGGHAGLDRQIEGEFRSPCDPVSAAWYQRDIEGRLAFLCPRADTVVVVLPAWPDDRSAWIYPDDAGARMECVRDTLRAATAGAEVSIVDFADYVCPGGSSGCRSIRERDGMHIDPDAAPDALRWLIGQTLATR